MTKEKRIDYRQCLYKLLEGLEIAHRDEFMEYAGPEECLMLGKCYAGEVFKLLSGVLNASISKEQVPPPSAS